jgi:arginase family enzyme
MFSCFQAGVVLRKSTALVAMLLHQLHKLTMKELVEVGTAVMGSVLMEPAAAHLVRNCYIFCCKWYFDVLKNSLFL